MNAAGQYPVKLYMLLMLDWRICLRVQFVIVGQYTCKFSLLFLWLNAHLHFVCFCYISIRIKIQLHVMGRYPSISICCSCGSIPISIQVLRFDIFLKGSIPLQIVRNDIGTVSDIGTQCQSKFTSGCCGSPAFSFD